MEPLVCMSTLPTDFCERSYVRNSFKNCPNDDYTEGKFRARRFSQFEITNVYNTALDMRYDTLKEVEGATFTQSAEINSYLGDVERKYQRIVEYKETWFLNIIKQFKEMAGFKTNRVGVHQMRLIARDGKPADPNPEGIHQDGFDYLGLVFMGRYNCTGCDLTVFDLEKKPILNRVMQYRDIIVLKDDRLMHHGSMVNVIDKNKIGYIDAYALTAKED